MSNRGLLGRPPELYTNSPPGRPPFDGPAYPRERHDQYEMHDPSILVYMFSLELSGQSSHMGRKVIKVKGRPRAEKVSVAEAMFWQGMDECEFLVDAEFGTLLRGASLVGGLEANVQEIVAVAFNEDIPEDVFELVPPPGTVVRVITENGEEWGDDHLRS